MKSRLSSYQSEASLEENARILSRFSWATNSGYKKCMVVVFIFLIFLFLFRYPIINKKFPKEITKIPSEFSRLTNCDFFRWINEIPEPPVIDIGQCKVKGEGRLTIGHVILTPSTDSDRVMVTFSTNLPTNELISVQYGTDQLMSFETFAASSQIPSNDKKYPYTYFTSFLTLKHGVEYYYRISCHNVHSETYRFYSWRSGSGWSPSIALVGGQANQLTVDTLTKKRHTLSLVTHIDNEDSLHSNEYLSLIQGAASHTPYLLIPGSAKASRLPLPGVEWPVEKDTFHTIVGPVIIIGFNSGNTEWLQEEFTIVEKIRAKYPWLVLISQNTSFCLPEKKKESACTKMFDLLVEHKVDLYISGSSLGYQRSWPIAADGSPLSTYHNSKGFVSVSLGLRSPKLGVPTISTLPAKYIMKNVSSVSSTLTYLTMERPDKMCLQVDNSHSLLELDRFCVDKRGVNIASVQTGDYASSFHHYDYNLTTWICLVVILSLVIIISLIFRNYLYSRLCKYMNSDGGPPVYTGRLLSV